MTRQCPSSIKKLKDVLTDAALVLGDARFMLMIFIYSSFWILYFQTFGSVLWFLRDFINTAPIDHAFASIGIPLKFDAEHVTVINAGTIILLQVVVSRVVKNIKPLFTIISGFSLGVIGFICLAFASNIWIFIIGLSVFSIGEMTAHPKYFSYIGLVAPTETKAVYMGYSFLYGVIGSLVGSNLGGFLYESMLKPIAGQTGIQGTVQTFWFIFVVIGILAIMGLLFYNRYFSSDTPAANQRARQIMISVYALFIIIGVWFFYDSAFAAESVAYKTMVQALIMLIIGSGGVMISLKHKAS